MNSSRPLLVAALAGIALLTLPLSSTAQTPVERYIVLLDAPPLAAYRGGIAGLEPTSLEATGARRLDADSAASRAYLAYLAREQSEAIARAEAAVGHSLDVRFRYSAALNGFAAVLTPGEADAVARLPGVARVVADSTRQLLTDNGPAWIGAPGIWDGSTTGGGSGTKGEGVVVGVIDTGINTDHPSFADPGPVDGFNHTNPRGRFFGTCTPVTCNDKLIGVYDFTPAGTGEDTNGHGSHTASTAAGNLLNAELKAPTMTFARTISGVAPHANVISYKACTGATAPVGECVVSALLAAINQAILDEVDVINYSIGGGPVDPWLDTDSLAFLNARRAGIFVSASAGNLGPGPGTVGSPANAPWLLSVAASTHDRRVTNGLDNMSGGGGTPPANIEGKGLTSGYGPARIVYAGAPPYNNALCGAGAANPDGSSQINPFPPGTFNGEIVVCDRGTYGRVAKGQNVKAGGAGGMVLVNDAANGDSLVGDAHALPAVHISFANGQTLKAWLASGTGHMATIRGFSPDIQPANGDVMASFSSRGPNVSAGFIKPDVTAPGVDIFAAFSDSSGPAPQFGVISGTSMSSPHAAGAAALLRALHPNWTPDEVKSALMTTAFTSPPGTGSEVHPVLKEDASTPADPFDIGGGRVDLRLAGKAGLVLDETAADYEAANPNLGGDPRELNLPSMADPDCAGTCAWTRVVKSTASVPVTWTASASGSGGLGLTVAPASFTLSPGQSQTINVTADTSGVGGSGWAFGRVVLDSSTAAMPDAALPVAVRPGAAAPTPTVTLHFHGNKHDGCTGVGGADVTTPPAGCAGPSLKTDATLDTEPAAAFTAVAGFGCTPASGGRCAADPNWMWDLSGPTTLKGAMSLEWWVSCPGCNTLLFDDWFVRLWADGTQVFEGRVRFNTPVPAKTAKLEATVTLPELNARDNFVLQLDPIFINQAETSVLYDSSSPCPGATTGPCDSLVRMPVVQSVANAPPVAQDDAAAVARNQSVDINVLGNDSDTDGDPLDVSAFTQGAFGTVSKNPDGTLKYTNTGATASDSFTYTVSDGRSGSDTANVVVTVTGPDLVVTSIEVARSSGNRHTISATVANSGTAEAPATKTEFVLDDTTVLGVADTPAIPAGRSETVTMRWSTSSVSGEHRITVSADKAADAAETNESNNVATRTVTVKGNKVQNGSFEQSSSGSAPDNWTSSGETGYTQGGSDGEKSVTAGATGSWVSDAIAVEPGKSYDFAVDATGAGGTVAVEQLSAAGAVVQTLALPVAASPFGAFNTIVGTLTVADGITQVRIRLAGTLGGAAGFDNVGLWER